jgi:threonine/homoserine/homoserine lactone efflux protein
LVGTFLLIFPFAFAGALSPMMLTEQTVLLATADGRRAAARYAIGATLVLLFFVGLVTLFGRVIELPSEPTLSASLDILLGAVLLLIAGLLVYLRRRALQPDDRSDRQRRESSMATNVTTLALVVPAAKIIAASGVDLPGRAILVALLVAIASTPAWLPVALTRVAPGPAERGLDWIRDLIEQRGRQLVVLLLVGLGLFLLVRGILGTI